MPVSDRHDARVVLGLRYPGAARQAELEVVPGFTEPRDYLESVRFFTELRRREALREELWTASEKGGVHGAVL